jgi:ribosomal protein S18 acetylase RimI-like enzyme
MNIRTMKIEDYYSAYELWTDTAGMGLRSLDDSYDGIEKFLKRNPNTNFICSIEDRLVGVILCGHDGRRGYIYHAAVALEFQRQGIGRQLVDRAIRALEEEGIHKAALLVFSSNEKGNQFWESMGWVLRNDVNYRNYVINQRNE